RACCVVCQRPRSGLERDPLLNLGTGLERVLILNLGAGLERVVILNLGTSFATAG
ncbi:unnamed protein product, partial [Tilletia caries]